MTLAVTPSASYQILASAATPLSLTSDDQYVALSQVAVFASDSSALERGANVGVFTFMRSNESLNLPLTIHFSLSGTATAGSDYQGLPTSVTIPAGSNSTTLTITPIDDTTIDVTIRSGVRFHDGSELTADAIV